MSFPGGTFSDSSAKGLSLNLLPDTLPLEGVLDEFSKTYESIQFRVATQFEIGDLARRSRNGVRVVRGLAKEHIVFSVEVPVMRGAFSSGSEPFSLTVSNTGEGGSITIDAPSGYHFQPTETPIPYLVVTGYLEKDPPNVALSDAIRVAIGEA